MLNPHSIPQSHFKHPQLSSKAFLILSVYVEFWTLFFPWTLSTSFPTDFYRTELPHRSNHLPYMAIMDKHYPSSNCCRWNDRSTWMKHLKYRVAIVSVSSLFLKNLSSAWSSSWSSPEIAFSFVIHYLFSGKLLNLVVLLALGNGLSSHPLN